MDNFKDAIEDRFDNVSELLYSFIDQAEEGTEKTDVLQTAFEKLTRIRKMVSLELHGQ